MTFDEWFEALELAAVDEFGYEPNEFPNAWADRWRKFFDAGLTPQQAYNQSSRESDEAANQRRAEADAKWKQIQERDLAALRTWWAENPSKDHGLAFRSESR
jgi:hypothetical protein